MKNKLLIMWIIECALFVSGESDCRKLEELEQLVWNPMNNLSDRQIDQFMVISR